MRSYAQFCSLAKALDVVGDRWTLLIVRELSLRGACRYTDLRNGLPGIATNLLADRLRELERAGVIEREDAPPPVATTLFRLTPRGEELRPALSALIHWGLPLMVDADPDDAVRSHWLASALEQTLTDRQPDAAPLTIELQTGDQPLVVEIAGGAVNTRLGRGDGADVRITGPAKPILGLLLGVIDLRQAKARGVTYEGDTAALDRISGALAPSQR